MRFPAIAAFALALSACASQPFYAPAAGPGRPGYSEQRIEQDRFSVSYRADGAADVRTIQDYALLRAGQITLNAGYDWFIVDRRQLDRGDAYGGPRTSIGIGAGSYGSRSGVGIGIGIPIDLGGGGERASAATLDIRLGRGPKPDDPNAYDARQVVHNLSATARSR